MRKNLKHILMPIFTGLDAPVNECGDAVCNGTVPDAFKVVRQRLMIKLWGIRVFGIGYRPIARSQTPMEAR